MAKVHVCYPISIEMKNHDVFMDDFKVTVEFRCSSKEIADRLWESCHIMSRDLGRPWVAKKGPDLSKFEAMEGGDG